MALVLLSYSSDLLLKILLKDYYLMKNYSVALKQLILFPLCSVSLLIVSGNLFYSSVRAEPAINPGKTENVITILIDGVRWEEVYRGIDKRFLEEDARSLFRHPERFEAFKSKYWSNDIKKRRQEVMPFTWKTIASEGQLYGNRDRGSNVNLLNPYQFSYPSHSEMLTGVADENIKVNLPVYNPNVTVLEYLARKDKYRGRVAAFSSWNLYPYIINTKRSNVAVHSPTSNFSLSKSNHTFEVLRDFFALQPRGIHSDIMTHHISMEYLKEVRPKVAHIVYSVTDRTAHEGHYDDYIEALGNADMFIERLWTWLQSQPDYAGKTTLIITTDHGRGSASPESWKYHGQPGYYGFTEKDGDITEGDEYSWIAALGPDTPALGEVSGGPVLYLAQIAATVSALLNEGFGTSEDTLRAAPPILTIMLNENIRH